LFANTAFHLLPSANQQHMSAAQALRSALVRVAALSLALVHAIDGAVDEIPQGQLQDAVSGASRLTRP